MFFQPRPPAVDKASSKLIPSLAYARARTAVKYSIFSLARNALSYHERWPRVWRSPEPRREYEVVIVGGGGPRPCRSLLSREKPRHH
jgi:hypothetical protein